jgi:hypothetical protein
MFALLICVYHFYFSDIIIQARRLIAPERSAECVLDGGSAAPLRVMRRGAPLNTAVHLAQGLSQKLGKCQDFAKTKNLSKRHGPCDQVQPPC